MQNWPSMSRNDQIEYVHQRRLHTLETRKIRRKIRATLLFLDTLQFLSIPFFAIAVSGQYFSTHTESSIYRILSFPIFLVVGVLETTFVSYLWLGIWLFVIRKLLGPTSALLKEFDDYNDFHERAKKIKGISNNTKKHS